MSDALLHATQHGGICVRLTPGLGNQMFQYAAGRALALRLGLPLLLDLSALAGATPARGYGLDRFAIAAAIASRAQVNALQYVPESRVRRFVRHTLRQSRRPASTFVREPHFVYWPGLEHHSGPALLSGYWQSTGYFAACADAIRRDFTFPALPPGPASELARRIGASPAAVAVHIRRGDYVADPQSAIRHGGCCEPDYYRRALDHLAASGGPLELFLFSDEPDWVERNFDPGPHRATVVDLSREAAQPHLDMHLMSLAPRQVIANSTFSWWAAWLNRVPGKAIVAPRRWFRDDADGSASASVVPPGWTRL